jgi:microsomal dipeptidase-like Zn-dependent dipeptidase
MRRAVLDCRRNLDENRLGEQAKTGGWLRLAALAATRAGRIRRWYADWR